ncbi:MAG: plasmid stabilization protein [Solirubrobacterales bacterium]
MAAITIRNLDDDAKHRLRVRAARHGRSMEAEARSILEAAVQNPYDGMNIGQAFRAAAAEVGYMDDLVIPPREQSSKRTLPYSEEWEAEGQK